MPNIQRLFKQAQKFCESDLFTNTEFQRCLDVTFDIEAEMKEQYGEEIDQFMLRYQLAQTDVLACVCLHYFHQGYLAAQAEREKDKGE